jgi:putative transposase
MPRGLKRYFGKGHLHFVTFSCYRRLPPLQSKRARNLFVRELGAVRNKMEFRLIGYVVMPEHVHLLLSESKSGTPSDVLHRLKLCTSRKMRGGRKNQNKVQLHFHLEGGAPALRAFWQPRFYDFNVCSQLKKKEKLNYMHANPVVRGLLEHPKDWPWSSWSLYAKNETGMLRIDAE